MSSLPGGAGWGGAGEGGGPPWAMTSHPSPYALTHFTFIRTGNDFPPMKVREEHNDSLVGEKWNLHPTTTIGPTFRKRCEGNAQPPPRWHGRERRHSTFLCIFLIQAALRHFNVLTAYMRRGRGGADGSVRGDALQSLYAD